MRGTVGVEDHEAGFVVGLSAGRSNDRAAFHLPLGSGRDPEAARTGRAARHSMRLCAITEHARTRALLWRPRVSPKGNSARGWNCRKGNCNISIPETSVALVSSPDGKSGPRLSPKSSNPPPVAANPTMARAITNIGSERSSVWSPPRSLRSGGDASEKTGLGRRLPPHASREARRIGGGEARDKPALVSFLKIDGQHHLRRTAS